MLIARGNSAAPREEFEMHATEHHDGQLLPMDAMAVCPFSDEDVANLVAELPRDMLPEVARLVAERMVGEHA